jgi:hypothetical protein
MNDLMSSISVQVTSLLNKNHLSTKVKKLFADRVTVPKIIQKALNRRYASSLSTG